MKKLLLLIGLLVSTYGFSQKANFKEYSYTQFFDMLENEVDSVFVLNDAIIKYNSKTDFDINQIIEKKIGDSINNSVYVIKKALKFNNVHFFTSLISIDSSDNSSVRGVFNNILFKKPVEIINSENFHVNNSVFDQVVSIRTLRNQTLDISSIYDIGFKAILLSNNIFNKGIWLQCDINKNTINQLNFLVFENTFNGNSEGYFRRGLGNAIWIKNSTFTNIYGNTFNVGAPTEFTFINTSLRFNGNVINSFFSKIGFSGELLGNIEFENNKFTSPINLELPVLKTSFNIDYEQFKHGIINNEGWENYNLVQKNSAISYDATFRFNPSKNYLDNYLNTFRYENLKSFKKEIEIRGALYDYYKEKHDSKLANKIYVENKDIETKRLAYEYKTQKSFNNYFTWKVNQFLKVFSAYGTQPAKAIVFSLYVIIIFALIYLFFPNSWDKHGKNRIIDRYSFFFKYMNKKTGIHEVYLEDQKEELMSYDAYKTLITQSKETVPRFFSVTALPLYKWAISGTKLTASMLKRVDIMKGTWSDLPQSKRIWKSILLVGAFLIAVLYDIFIKMLNALMLSINTFTTLGFGEIPIKGLPRYLAIIQGFIGWFMLTIFSVSLISQLLN